MSQVEYSLHHCYQQVNDLLARYNGQTQAEGYLRLYEVGSQSTDILQALWDGIAPSKK